MLNDRVQTWFNNGYFKEALLGDNKYRIPDITYRENHDTILIMRQLFIWIDINKKENFQNQFENIITELIKTRFKDAIDILLAYFIVKKNYKHILDTNLNFISQIVSNEIKNNAYNIAQNELVRNRIVELSKYIPNIIK